MANTLNSTDYIARRFALALDKKLTALKDTEDSYRCDRSGVGPVTHQVSLAPMTGFDIADMDREELDASIERAAISSAKRLSEMPGLTFHKMEIPLGVPNVAQVDLRGLIVRVLPIYDPHTNQQHIVITMAYS